MWFDDLVVNLVVVSWEDKELMVSSEDRELFEELLSEEMWEGGWIIMFNKENYDDGENNGEGVIYRIGFKLESIKDMVEGKCVVLNREGNLVEGVKVDSEEKLKEYFIYNWLGYKMMNKEDK